MLAPGASVSVALLTTNTVTTGSITTQPYGSGIWMAVGWHSGATPVTPTDNKGNVYVNFGSDTVDATFIWRRYYCANAVGGAGHTFTFTSTGSALLLQIMVQEVTTNNGRGILLDQAAVTGSLTVSPWTSPSVTTTVPNEILIGAMLGHSSSGTAVFGGLLSFTVNTSITDGTNDNAACAGTLVVAATGNYTSSFSEAVVVWSTVGVSIDTFSEVAIPFFKLPNPRPRTKGSPLGRRFANRQRPFVGNVVVVTTVTFRKTLSGIGTKTGSRQTHNS